jgi:hypothetical protein
MTPWLLLIPGALTLAALLGVVGRRRGWFTDHVGSDPWDETGDWCVYPPWSKRNCHPDVVDIDCVDCRRWLRARALPAAGVDP